MRVRGAGCRPPRAAEKGGTCSHGRGAPAKGGPARHPPTPPRKPEDALLNPLVAWTLRGEKKKGRGASAAIAGLVPGTCAPRPTSRVPGGANLVRATKPWSIAATGYRCFGRATLRVPNSRVPGRPLAARGKRHLCRPGKTTAAVTSGHPQVDTREEALPPRVPNGPLTLIHLYHFSTRGSRALRG
jgi:hypothetical protein